MADDIENEGAIDTGDDTSNAPDDNSGAAPPVAAPAQDDSGAAPVAQQEAIPTQQEQPTGPNGPIARALKAFPGNAKRIVSYLMGEGAEHPAVLDQAAAAVDPEGARSQGDRNILAVDAAAQKGGPEAAWKLVQANRVAYNAKQAFAYAALNGNQQKPADINAAIQAANQAADHVLDGSSVQFAPGQGGVTATVTQPGAKAPQTYNLSTDQFREYLNVGRTGQWDRMMQDGVGGTLQKIASGANHQRPAAPRPQAAQGAPQPQAPKEAPQAPAGPKQTNFGSTPSTMNLSGNQDAIPDSQTEDRTGYDPQLQARADKLFPGITQDGQKQAWMAAQEQRQDELQNKVDVAAETGKNRIATARATGQGRLEQEQARQAGNKDVAEVKLKGWQYASDAKRAAAQIAADQKTAAGGDRGAQQRIETGRKAIAAKRATGANLTPEEETFEKSLTAQPQQRQAPQQAPQQRQAPQQQAPSAQPPVPGARQYQGKWYTRGPNGESVPVQ